MTKIFTILKDKYSIFKVDSTDNNFDEYSKIIKL